MKQLIKSAYEKIVSNLESLLNKYETKIKQQEKPFTKDEVLIDMYENDKYTKTFDPEGISSDLILKTKNEEITLHHSAKNRRMFAEGALFAAEYLRYNHQKIAPGLYNFSDIIKTSLIP